MHGGARLYVKGGLAAARHRDVGSGGSERYNSCKRNQIPAEM